MHLFRSLLLAALAAWLVAAPALAQVGAPGPAPVPPPPVRPGHLVVKYASHVHACMECTVRRGQSVASVTGSASLDALHAHLGLRDARALFGHDHGPGRDPAEAFAERLGRVRGRFPARTSRIPAAAVAPDLGRVYVLELAPGVDVGRAAALYRTDPDVEWAEPDYRVRARYLTNDPLLSSAGTWGQPYADLWGLHKLEAPRAWDTARGEGVVVAVIDTGIKYTHRDLAANVWTNAGEIPRNGKDDDGNGYVDDVYGWDFVKNRPKPRDKHGHGTHVAGTIAAVGDNARGVVGAAWRARVMAVRGLDANGEGYTSDLARGMVYALENGADVLNNSWGSWFQSRVIGDAIAAARSVGAVVVFAAGNDGNSLLGDAANPGAIAVAASDPFDATAPFSNFADAMSVAAPGVDVLSVTGGARVGGLRIGGSYSRLSGTSMAAPHVAGVAALLLSARPTLTPDEVRWHLELNADQPGHPGWEGAPWNPHLGWGRVNAARVFTPPPATTRFARPRVTLHHFAGAVAPDVFKTGFHFTTIAPVDWTLAGPAWLTPSLASGTGPATASFALDVSGEPVGRLDGAVVVSAPATADGGSSLPVTVELHHDHRAGGEIPVALDVRYLNEGPRVAADPAGALVLWIDGARGARMDLVAARIDGAGTVGVPVVVGGTSLLKSEDAVGVAFDGTNYLIAWHEKNPGRRSGSVYVHEDFVRAIRVSPTLDLLDPAPLELAYRRLEMAALGENRVHFTNVEVAFDGTAFTVLWNRDDIHTDEAESYVRRVATDGTVLGPAVQIYPTPATSRQIIRPKIACIGDGTCLVAWTKFVWETVPSVGRVVVGYLEGIRLAGDQPLEGGPTTLVRDVTWASARYPVAVASDGAGYMLLAVRRACTPLPCRHDAIGARVTGAGVPLDPDGFTVSRGGSRSTARLMGLAWDGTQYIATFADWVVSYVPPDASPGALGYSIGSPLFAARVSPDGVVRDAEPIGVLVHPRESGLSGDVACTATACVIAWQDLRAAAAWHQSVYAQRLVTR